jgi:UDP-N-acetylmuramoylalanine--D-glutamate ligase
MIELANKQVLVIGLGGRGGDVCEVLRRAGANVTALDHADTQDLRAEAGRLRLQGIDVRLGASSLPEQDFALAVVAAEVDAQSPLVRSLIQRHVPIIGELELSFQQAKCLSIAVAGTNGKSTTAGLVHRLLEYHHRKTLLIGPEPAPLGALAEQSKDLDYLVLVADALQLEQTRFFRPAVAVLLNLAPDQPERYPGRAEYVRANARLFKNQQPFDWAIVQAEALAQLKELDLLPPSKIITFSAHLQESDLHLDRGLILSRLANWSGPLLDTDQCRLRGPHNAENFMAALAVGHALRLPLETMVKILKTQPPGPHRCELVAEIGGVQFINDSKATNPDALRNALLAARPGAGGTPNIWLIAGGRDRGLDFHEVGPHISKCVKGAFLIGEAREKIRAAWGLFTPCTLSDSLLEAVTEAAKNATAGDVVLLSPACSSFDQFQNYQQRGERFYQAVKSISGGRHDANPHMNGNTTAT